MPPILHPPPAWTTSDYSRHVVLWHGCLRSQLRSIRHGIDPTKGDPATDFGRGFYTSTVVRQARHWAWKRWTDLSLTQRQRDSAHVIRFRVPLSQLAGLEGLHFVLGGHDQDRYWSFVHHCRQSTPSAVRTHARGRNPADDWYDVVSGPVAAFWSQCAVMDGSDQFSFHTPAAARVLNDLVRSGDPQAFRVFRVRERRRP
jgi:hypothetical protein